MSHGRLPCNTAVSYSPIGLVMTMRIARYRSICAIPLKVNDMRTNPLQARSEFVGPQKRDHQVDPDQQRDDAHDEIFQADHVLPGLFVTSVRRSRAYRAMRSRLPSHA